MFKVCFKSSLYRQLESQGLLGCKPSRFITLHSKLSYCTQAKTKLRLDEYCLQQNPQYSRNVIQSWILQGKVLVDGKPVLKCGTQIQPTANVKINAEVPKYVCRAGLKLEAAIEHFNIDVKDKIVLDSGLSTGGFTDCLLQYGASQVFGVDVGYGEVAEKIRQDERVIVMERTNLRYLTLEDLNGCRVDLATIDLAFISVIKVMNAVCSVIKDDGELVVLIKPQFEAGKQNVNRGGVVRDSNVHDFVIKMITQGVSGFGFDYIGYIESPIKGAKGGNTEFVSYFKRNLQKCVLRT